MKFKTIIIAMIALLIIPMVMEGRISAIMRDYIVQEMK
jgi:hypothetical protein